MKNKNLRCSVEQVLIHFKYHKAKTLDDIFFCFESLEEHYDAVLIDNTDGLNYTVLQTNPEIYYWFRFSDKKKSKTIIPVNYFSGPNMFRLYPGINVIVKNKQLAESFQEHWANHSLY